MDIPVNDCMKQVVFKPYGSFFALCLDGEIIIYQCLKGTGTIDLCAVNFGPNQLVALGIFRDYVSGL